MEVPSWLRWWGKWIRNIGIEVLCVGVIDVWCVWCDVNIGWWVLVCLMWAFRGGIFVDVFLMCIFGIFHGWLWRVVVSICVYSVIAYPFVYIYTYLVLFFHFFVYFLCCERTSRGVTIFPLGWYKLQNCHNAHEMKVCGGKTIVYWMKRGG